MLLLLGYEYKYLYTFTCKYLHIIYTENTESLKQIFAVHIYKHFV